MPFSNLEGKDWIANRVMHHRPSVIYDIGAGQGTYSTMLRYRLPETTFIGVEVWTPYIETYDLLGKYDLLQNKDARAVLYEGASKADSLAILGDVLEHLPEADARELIERLKEKFRWIALAVPIIECPQGSVFGNPYEAHLKHWTFEELLGLMGTCEVFKGDVIGCFFWEGL